MVSCGAWWRVKSWVKSRWRLEKRTGRVLKKTALLLYCTVLAGEEEEEEECSYLCFEGGGGGGSKATPGEMDSRGDGECAATRSHDGYTGYRAHDMHTGKPRAEGYTSGRSEADKKKEKRRRKKKTSGGEGNAFFHGIEDEDEVRVITRHHQHVVLHRQSRRRC